VVDSSALKGRGGAPSASRAAQGQIESWALKAAEKLIATAIPYGFVTGHDFSRADKARQINVGLQPLQK
jgi:hypothetical protein